MQQFEEVKTHNATIYFSNGNKYIGPVHYDDFHWKIGKYGCQEYLDLLVKTGAETPQKQENATL